MSLLHMLVPDNKHNYHFSIYQVGYEKCEPNHFFGPTIRDFYVFHFLVSGKGFYQVRGKTVQLKAGDCFLVIPNEPIFYRADPDDPYEYYWVGFHEHTAMEVMTQCGFYTDDNFTYCHPEEYDRLLYLMQQMVGVEDTSEKNMLNMLGHFYQLLGLMMKENARFEPYYSSDNVLEKINQYLSANYQQTITVENLALFVNMSRSNLYRLFMKEYGISPIQYLHNYRLDKALFMLKRSDMTTQQIAYFCGFTDVSYFCKLFKRKFQKSPHEVRELI